MMLFYFVYVGVETCCLNGTGTDISNRDRMVEIRWEDHYLSEGIPTSCSLLPLGSVGCVSVSGYHLAFLKSPCWIWSYAQRHLRSWSALPNRGLAFATPIGESPCRLSGMFLIRKFAILCCNACMTLVALCALSRVQTSNYAHATETFDRRWHGCGR